MVDTGFLLSSAVNRARHCWKGRGAANNDERPQKVQNQAEVGFIL